jgi:Mg2+-importing ATPase
LLRNAELTRDKLLSALGTRGDGLTTDEARQRPHPPSPHAPGPLGRLGQALRVFLGQFRSPITLMLLAAALLSWFVGQRIDAMIILLILSAGAGLGFWQEYSAHNALAGLLALVQTRATVLRDGQPVELLADEVVPGDVVLLAAGASVPGDCRLLEARDLFVHEAALTGEPFPVEKQAVFGQSRPPDDRSFVLLQGSHVISGTGRAVVVATGTQTELGQISQHLRLRPPETEFERGVRRLGHLLMETTLLILLAVLTVHLALHRPPLESLLFAMALAVGLTPQLLPAVITVNLAYGARKLAAAEVIVRRLASLENFGSMNVLCCDKTGTLTSGQVVLSRAVDPLGTECRRPFELAQINAHLETGFRNPIDDALRRLPRPSAALPEKLDEIPYDFVRKRLSVLVREDDHARLITKGAVDSVLAICQSAALADGRCRPLPEVLPVIDALREALGSAGLRVLAVAEKVVGALRVTRDDEQGLTLVGFLVFHDPPQEGIADTLAALAKLGIRLKMITGDAAAVAVSVAREVGLSPRGLLTGGALRTLSDEALIHRVGHVDVFAEIEPTQKERLVLALKKAGNVVGFLGDGINDASALHAADVGISVAQAVPVAREAADIVLLRKDLGVLQAGVEAGRATFANTLKYILLATSANFGNMFSMAGASLWLPFLPLLPKQVLLNNLLTDLPEMTIARDRVDAEMVCQPQRWDVGLIRRFMAWFGLISSFYDYLTFAILLWLFHANETQFRTGWFVESVVSACLVVLVVRSRRPLGTDRPAAALLATTLAVIVVAIGLPYSPLAAPLAMTPLPWTFVAAMLTLVLAYAATAEVVKRWFYHREARRALARPLRPGVPPWPADDPGRDNARADPVAEPSTAARDLLS